MLTREDFTNQIIGNRKIIRNYCVDTDWLDIGKPLPKDINNYRLSECLNCGAKVPVYISNLQRRPPKKCSFCSNIKNNSTTIQSNTNNWAVYETYASVNVVYKNSVVTGYVSIDDYHDASSRIWRVSKKKNKYYLISGSRSKNNVVYMHRFIMRNELIPDGYEVDHIDGNSLNNRRGNLRIVSRNENIRNASQRIDNQIGIRGVSPDGHGKYIVDFSYDNKRYHFKPWKTIEEAVYCRGIVEELFGLEMLKRNPKAKYIDVLPKEKRDEIYAYVLSKISRKRRYESLH